MILAILQYSSSSLKNTLLVSCIRRRDRHSHPQRQDEVDPRARPRSQRRSLSARESRALPQARTCGHPGALPPRRLATEVSRASIEKRRFSHVITMFSHFS